MIISKNIGQLPESKIKRFDFTQRTKDEWKYWMNIIWELYGSREIANELCIIKKQNKIIFYAHVLNPSQADPLWMIFFEEIALCNAHDTVDDTDQHLFDDYLIFS